MSESVSSSPILADKFPYLFEPSVDMVRGVATQLRQNEEFTADLLPSQFGSTHGYLDKLTIRACGRVLTEADRRFGRHTGELGALQDGDGIWAKYAMPTFYHNGDGTRQAMIGTASYMDYVNASDKDSPYKDRKTYLASLLTAAFDDIVFGEYGRGGDELQSMEVARIYLEQQGFPADMVKAVLAGIEASIFNEETSQQNIDEARGYLPVQKAPNTGDLWAPGTAIGSMNAAILAVENLWKRDRAEQHRQVLRTYARALPEWRGKRLPDLLALIQQDPESHDEYGKFLSGNEAFLQSHRYPDKRIDRLMKAGKEQNAILQGHIGRLILSGDIDVHDGFRCAVGYAWLSDKRLKNDTFSAKRMEQVHRLQLTPVRISRLLLRRRSPDMIRNPLSANDYVDRYQETLR